VAEPAGPGGRVADHRARPRRRGERLLAAVHAAVLDELHERGYAALTVDAVAARAGTSKASLYRRWPGKRELVLAAVAATVPEPEDLPDTGSLRGDLVAYLGQVSAHLGGPAGAALRGLVGHDLGASTASAGAPELDGSVHRRRSTDRLRVLADRAVARGDLGADQVAAVTARQWEAGPALLRQHFLAEGAVGEGLCAEIVDEVVLPLLTRGGAPGTSAR
jgi:AcrR family transcriptional regulator